MNPLISLYSFVFDLTIFHETFTKVQYGALSELVIVYLFLFIWTVYEANKKTETIAVKRTVKYIKQNLETLDSQPNATPI